jgi:hypothetical protein
MGGGVPPPPPVPPPPGQGRTADGDYTSATHYDPNQDWAGASNAGLAPRPVLMQMANDIREGIGNPGQFREWADGMGYSDGQRELIWREIQAIIAAHGGMRD